MRPSVSKASPGADLSLSRGFLGFGLLGSCFLLSGAYGRPAARHRTRRHASAHFCILRLHGSRWNVGVSPEPRWTGGYRSPWTLRQHLGPHQAFRRPGVGPIRTEGPCSVRRGDPGEARRCWRCLRGLSGRGHGRLKNRSVDDLPDSHLFDSALFCGRPRTCCCKRSRRRWILMASRSPRPLPGRRRRRRRPLRRQLRGRPRRLWRGRRGLRAAAGCPCAWWRSSRTWPGRWMANCSC